MNRTLTFIMTCILTLALAACGGTTVAPTPTPAQNATAVPTIVETTPKPVATETVVPAPTIEEATPTSTITATPAVRGTAIPIPTETIVPTATTPVRGTPEPLPTEAPVDDSLGLAVPMTVELLKNSEYLIPSAYGTPVQLEEGVYEDRSDPNATLFVRLLEENIAYGDVDGDGLEDAVIPFATNTGGSGVFMDIIVVSGESGTVGQLASAFLGDRVVLNSITAAPGIVTVNMIVSGPNDPSCCPTLEVTVPFIYENGTLTPGEGIENGTVPLPTQEGAPQ
jgi:hypothetical protein